MIHIKQLSMPLLGIAFLACNACSGNTLQIKPTMIEAFKDNKVIAMDDSDKYQIGDVGNKWSQVYDIGDKGLSLLDTVATTNAGIFLIGEEKQVDTENKHNLLNNTYFTGLIVLIDSNNRTIREWRTKASFSDVSVHHNQLTLTSPEGIYTLNANSEIKLVENNDERQWLTPIHDREGNLILCNSPFGLKDEQSGWYSKAQDWVFGGSWYLTNSTTKPTPIMCGSWIITTWQEGLNSPLSALEVHDIKSGRLIKRVDLSDFQRFFCINDSEVMTNSSLQSYVLPELKPGNTYSCNKNEMILSVKKGRDESICLTTSGHVGVLKKDK